MRYVPPQHENQVTKPSHVITQLLIQRSREEADSRHSLWALNNYSFYSASRTTLNPPLERLPLPLVRAARGENPSS